MTLETTTTKVSYACTGLTEYQITFPFFVATDIAVSWFSPAGVETAWVQGTDYDVDMDTMERITLAGAPLLTPPTTGTLLIKRLVPLTQEVDYVEGDAFPASAHEGALDKIVAMAQQIQEQVERAVLASGLGEGIGYQDFVDAQAAAEAAQAAAEAALDSVLNHIGAPNIWDFTLAQHTHATAMQGGKINHTSLNSKGTNTHDQIDAHLASTANPHAVTAAQAGAAPTTRTISTTAPLAGGGDLSANRTLAVSAASTDAPGVVELATTAETQAGTDTSRVVTVAGLFASAKGLISANTTIYVATTGNDTTGDGSSGAPYATIAKALSSIAGKLIATGISVTISVADGVYSGLSTILITHPDADKIFLSGDTTAEPAWTILAITTGTKTISVSGDQTAIVAVGDVVVIDSGSTTANKGAYTVASATLNGANTDIVVSEAIASATVGGATLRYKYANKCILQFASGQTGVKVNFLQRLGGLNGFRLEGSGVSYGGVHANNGSALTVGAKMIVRNFTFGIYATYNSHVVLSGPVVMGGTQGLYADTMSSIGVSGPSVAVIADASGAPGTATNASFIDANATYTIKCRNGSSDAFSPSTGGNNYGSWVNG